MTPHLKLLVCLAMLPGAALAQTADQSAVNQSSTTGSPVAYVYVTRPTHVDGFAASSTGKLTPVPGSPFANISLSHLSLNKSYLFGPGDDAKTLYSFSTASNGSLKPVSSINAQKYNPNNCGGFGPTQLDRTGSTLYNQVNSDCESVYQSFKIEANGALQYLGNVDAGFPGDVFTLGPISVLGNNQYAYQTGNAEDSFVDPATVIYRRESNGLFTYDSYYNQSPTPKNSADEYISLLLAVDPTNHLAYAYQANDEMGDYVGPIVLATYTADSHGNLTTSSTYKNMPATNLSYVSAMSISPTGKLLAAGGPGFQVFHFNGSSPITHYTGVFQGSSEFLQFGWDKSNHLYALSTGKLFVYTVTPTSITQAPGSPYSIPQASSVIVRSLP